VEVAGVPQHLAFSADGRILAAAAYIRKTESTAFQLYDLERGRPVNYTGQMPGQVTAMALSPDGRVAALATGDYLNISSVLPQHNTITRLDDGARGTIRALAFSPDSRLLVVGRSELRADGLQTTVWYVPSREEPTYAE
jgi:WD40 repeat protein